MSIDEVRFQYLNASIHDDYFDRCWNVFTYYSLENVVLAANFGWMTFMVLTGISYLWYSYDGISTVLDDKIQSDKKFLKPKARSLMEVFQHVFRQDTIFSLAFLFPFDDPDTSADFISKKYLK